jgi:outer membrane protein
MKKIPFIFLILLLFLKLGGETISLSEAKSLALANNPDLLAQEQATKSSKAGYWKSLLGLIPSASMNGNYTIYDDEIQMGLNSAEESRSYGFTISQPVFNGGSIWLGSRLSSDAYKISQESLKISRLNTLSEVESKYFSVLENNALLEIAEKSLQTADTNLEIANVKFENGSLSRADLLNMQSEKAAKEVNMLQMENLYQISLIALANFLQLPEITEMVEIDMTEHQYILSYLQNTGKEELEILINKIMQQGMENNPALKISELAVSGSQKGLLMAGGKFLPSLNLQYSRNWMKYNYEEDYNDSGQLGIYLSLPIFPILDNGLGVAEANFDLKQARFNYSSAEDNINLLLKSTLLSLITIAKTVHSSELAMEYAAQTYEQMQERFNSGLITTNDLLSSEIMYTSAQSQYVTSIYDYLRTRSLLREQIGLEDEQILENYMK